MVYYILEDKVHHQDKAGLGLKQESEKEIQKPWQNAVPTDPLSMAPSGLFSLQPSSTYSGEAPPTCSGLVPLISVINHKDDPTDLPIGQSDQGNSSNEVPPSDCLYVSVKLTKTSQYKNVNHFNNLSNYLTASRKLQNKPHNGTH